MIVAFTGHRPNKIPDPERVRTTVREALMRLRPLYVIVGMAQGVDQWAAEVCLELGIPFVAALPCDGMDAVWPPAVRDRFHALLNKAKEIHVVSPGPYKPWKMQRRNEWMVDHCTRLLAVFDGSSGGTYNCLAYAAEIGREVVHLPWRDA